MPSSNPTAFRNAQIASSQIQIQLFTGVGEYYGKLLCRFYLNFEKKKHLLRSEHQLFHLFRWDGFWHCWTKRLFLNSWWSLKSLCGMEKLQYSRKFQTRQMLMLWDGCQTAQQFQSISIIGALGMRLRSQLSYKSDLWSVSKCSGRCINTHVKYKYPKFGLNFSIWVTVSHFPPLKPSKCWVM